MTTTSIREDEDNGESSGSDRDDVFDEDIDALRRACMLTGRNPGDIDDSDADSGRDSSETDDLDLLRSIQERFSIPSTAINSLPVVKHHSTCPPSDSDEEDDFETLRAIQKRFAQYECDSMKKKSVFSHESEVVATSVTSEQEAASYTFTNRKGETLGQGYQYPVDALAASEPSGSASGAGLENQLYSFSEWHQEEDETCNLSARLLVYSRFPKSAQLFFDALKKNRLRVEKELAVFCAKKRILVLD